MCMCIFRREKAADYACSCAMQEVLDLCNRAISEKTDQRTDIHTDNPTTVNPSLHMCAKG